MTNNESGPNVVSEPGRLQVSHGLSYHLVRSVIAVVVFTLVVAWAFKDQGVTASPKSWIFALLGGVMGLGIHHAVRKLTELLWRPFPWRLLVYVTVLVLLAIMLYVFHSAVTVLKNA